MSNPDAQARGRADRGAARRTAGGGGPQVAAAAEELVSCLVELYGAGLARITAILGADEAEGHQGTGPRLLDKLVADPLVESLLVLHDLHPLDTSARVRRAVEQVLPQLGSHAGDVEYLGLDDTGVLRLRLEQRGCSAATVRDLDLQGRGGGGARSGRGRHRAGRAARGADAAADRPASAGIQGSR